MAGLVSGNFPGTAMSMTNDQAKVLVANAVANANTYLQGLKMMAGGTEGIPMKTMDKDQQDWKQLTDYYNQQGLVGPKTSTDPTADIRAIGEAWAATTDPTERNKYHQMALDLATKAGWLKPGETVASVSSMPQMSAAGTPTYESQMDQLALALRGSGGGGGTGGTSGAKAPSAQDKTLATSALKDQVYKLAHGLDWSDQYAAQSTQKMYDWLESVRPNYEARGADVDDAVSYLTTLLSGKYPKDIRVDMNK